MFLVILHYTQPLEKVDELMNEHVLYLEKHYKESKFIFSGRLKPRVGGLILVNVHDKEVVDGIIRQDPFYKCGVADYEVLEFTPTKYDTRFSCFMNQDDEVS